VQKIPVLLRIIQENIMPKDIPLKKIMKPFFYIRERFPVSQKRKFTIKRGERSFAII
jgi:hypothetical protein